MQLVRVLTASSLPRLQSVTIDGSVLAFAAGTCVAVGLLCGMLPAAAAARADATPALVEGAYASESARQGRLRSLLIAGERFEHGEVEAQALPACGGRCDYEVLAAHGQLEGLGLMFVELVHLSESERPA